MNVNLVHFLGVADTAAGESFYLDHAGYRRTYTTGNPVEFSARQIRVATMDFDDDNIIGRGGFGTVYKGRLETGQVRIQLLHALRMHDVQY